MPSQDTSQIKEKIVSFLKRNGPSLPVHIAKGIETNTLFTSAFLSELTSEKRIRISCMRVGNSPLYFLEGQEPSLDKFFYHLRNKEKEAFSLLKEKRFLIDSEQDPAIRVALREIKDFAVPFREPETNKIFWRFHTISESEMIKKEKMEKKIEIVSEKKKQEEQVNIPSISLKKAINIFEEEKKEEELKEKKEQNKRYKKKKASKKGTSSKGNNQFFEKVKEFLSKKSIEITDIVNFNKNEIILKIKEQSKDQEKLLIAYNKNKVNESDIIKSSKRALELKLPYIILNPGGPLKKINELIFATKNLHSFENLK